MASAGRSRQLRRSAHSRSTEDVPTMSSLLPPLVSAHPGATTGVLTLDRAAAEIVVALASRAPSVHNTQPWQWHLGDAALDLRADRSRQLPVADPDGHSLLISCGAAAELTRLALAAQGWAADTVLLPDDRDRDLLARFHVRSRGEPDPIAERDLAAAGRRRSERRVFGPRPVSAQAIEALRVAAQRRGCSRTSPPARRKVFDWPSRFPEPTGPNGTTPPTPRRWPGGSDQTDHPGRGANLGNPRSIRCPAASYRHSAA